MSPVANPTQLAAWASRGPRYTSYPPATAFSKIDPGSVARELAQIGELHESISLYLHIPFCRSLCWYCGCNVIPTRDTARGTRYVEQLNAEASQVGRAVHGATVTEISFGGGSPNFLSASSLLGLFETIDQTFVVASDARRSIELDPRTSTSDQIEALAAARFGSMSMGVQDFSEAVQDAIHRHQTVVQTRWLVDRARAAGFDDINIDVVYGLPLQTETSFAKTLEAVIDLAPDRVALFGYAHLPSKLPHQRLVELVRNICMVFDRYNAEAVAGAQPRFSPTI
jgi:oxygen-independent coproporphyrinogen-3 oxidase